LPPCDASGASDPYVQIWNSGEYLVKTNIVEQTNNPLWYETKDFDIEFTSKDDAPPIILDIFDTDDAGMFSLSGNNDNDDFIGRAIIFMHEIDDLAIDDHIPIP
jgi:Ca2+-dependent lipid-binding protein